LKQSEKCIAEKEGEERREENRLGKKGTVRLKRQKKIRQKKKRGIVKKNHKIKHREKLQ
jgi:hypothetical protein